ncbi:MAG: cyclic pyranopterin monophosphate synthase MoaC [Candidatus Omnitrophota bacterium]
MIDITKKKISEREASIAAKIYLKPSVITAIKKKKIPKGDVLEAAKLAGILAAKRTPGLIPLCHPIPLESVTIEFSIKRRVIEILVTAKGIARTGVEMEAFTAASVSAITIYDMCKFADRAAVISDIRLIRKSGGKSGAYVRKRR